MAPLLLLALVFVATFIFAQVASMLRSDNSWFDRHWSLLPVGLQDTPPDLLPVLLTLWGVALTADFARKGGFSNGEDYRQAVLHSRMTDGQFGLFAFFFIVVDHNILLVVIVLPGLTVLENRDAPSVLSTFCSAFCSAFSSWLSSREGLAGGTVADQRQWDFNEWKRAELAAGREPGPRFLEQDYSACLGIRISSSNWSSGWYCPSSGRSRSVQCCSGRARCRPPHGALRWFDDLRRDPDTRQISREHRLPAHFLSEHSRDSSAAVGTRRHPSNGARSMIAGVFRRV